MKLQLIENICKQTVSLVLLTGICLLYSKGIIPVYLPVLFLLSGTLISLLFRTFTLIVKIIIALTVMAMILLPLKGKDMRPATSAPSAPVMQAAGPATNRVRPVKKRIPDTTDGPKRIGYYLEPLRGIASNPDRQRILKNFFKETYV